MLPPLGVLHEASVEQLAVLARRIAGRDEAQLFERTLRATPEGRVFCGSDVWLRSPWGVAMPAERKVIARRRGEIAARLIQMRSPADVAWRQRLSARVAVLLEQGGS